MYNLNESILNELVNVTIPLNNFESYAVTIEEFLHEKFINTVVIEPEEDDYNYNEYQYNHDEDDDDNDFINAVHSLTFFQSNRYRYSQEFPNLMRTSLFLSIYSFLEHHLITLCKYLQRKKGGKISVSDLKHNGIDKAQVYLSKVIGIDFPSQSPEWNYIKNCNKIRNCIVHNGGLVERENKNLKNVIKGIETVSIVNNLFEEKIKLEKDFCLEFLGKIKNLFEKLSNETYNLLYPYGF